MWKSVFNDVQEYFISKGSGESQNVIDNFEKSKRVYGNQNRIRNCSSALFTRIHPLTNEKLNRTWLCYSPTNGKVYCFMCNLLSCTQTDLYQGFNDWKNAKRAIEMHEKSPCHLATTLACKPELLLRGIYDWLEGLMPFMKNLLRLAGRVDVIHEEKFKS